jgi:hypothetical protein
MRFRTTLVLILLLLGLGAYVYWIEMPKAEQEAKKKTLFEFKADDATEVSLAYSDHEIVLKKSGDDWRLTKPMDVAADQTAAKNLVSAIADCEVKKSLDESATDRAQYGLDAPFVKVTVKLKDKELPAILVGKNTPVGFSTYIQKAGDPKVMLTNSAFRSGMDKKVKDLRDKTILNFADNDVQKIEIHGEGKDITFAQKDAKWSIEQPGPYAADDTTMRSFLSTLRSMRAVDFPDDQPSNLSTYGLDNPRLKVMLYLGKDNAQKEVRIGAETEKKEVYLQTSGQPAVYTVSDWIVRDLSKSVADFRDKTLLAFDRDKITAVDVKRRDGEYKLVRGDDQQWRVAGVDGKPAEPTISQFLGDLHDLKGFEIAADHPADLSQFALDQPLLTIAVHGEEDKLVGTVLIGLHQTDSKKDYTAMAEGGPTVFLVRDYLFTRLDKKPQDFVEKPPATPGTGTPTAQINNAQDDSADDATLQINPGQEEEEPAAGDED